MKSKFRNFKNFPPSLTLRDQFRPPCLSKCNKSGYQADIETTTMKDPETIEDKVGNESPSKRFRRSFRNKEKKTKSTEETQDTYLADVEYSLESTDWQNDSSMWGNFSEFSDLDSSDDDSDWEL